MALRRCFSTPDEAWQAYLEYSEAARTITTGAVGQLIPNLSPAEMLEFRGAGRWKSDLELYAKNATSNREKIDVLRALKNHELVRLGFIEFATDTDIASTAESLSWLACFSLQNALDLVLGPVKDREFPQNPLTILGLGKLGGMELNYSSDVDLMFVYLEESDGGGESAHAYHNRICRRLVQEATAASTYGQLYRVDLRLRPEGDQGPLARSIEGYEVYYAGYGEIWERLALLKTGHVGGSRETFYEFHQMIQPFCYSREALPQLLSEIAHLKERTEREIVGKGEYDYHVKLGPGGIRDIEFFVQGQQLLHGKKLPWLQTTNTLKAIAALRQVGLIEHEVYDLLSSGYRFWRRLEHRIQILQHQQTHSLPHDAETMDQIARSLDFPSGAALWEEQLAWRKKIRAIYDAFYDEGGKNSGTEPSAEFVGDFFKDPDQSRKTWNELAGNSGEFHVSKRTLASFVRLAPGLSEELKKAIRPDLALTQFAGFVQSYGSRSLLYETLVSYPKALELLIRLFDSSTFLGEILRARPDVFEEVSRGNLDEMATRASLERQLGILLARAEDPGTTLREFVRGNRVRVALRWLLKLTTLREMHHEYTALAETALQGAWKLAGEPRLAVIGLGKFGGGDLVFGSDLDVLFVGEDNEKAQEIVRFMSAKTNAGSLFAVDPRLRPYGEGKLARSVEEYRDYYAGAAQLWEVQTLCRTRWVVGDPGLGKDFFTAVMPSWRKRFSPQEIVEGLRSMRDRIEQGRCKSGNPELEFKTGAGGIMDVEFATQAWQMVHGEFETSTSRVCEMMERDFPEQGKILLAGYDRLREIEAWLRFDENQPVAHLPPDEAGQLYLARKMGLASALELMQFLKRTREAIREAFLGVYIRKAKG